MAPRAEIGFCNLKEHSVTPGFSQLIQSKLSQCMVQHLPHLWQPPTIKESSNFFSIQSKTWCPQLSLLNSTEVYKAPFDLGFSSFVLISIIHVWSLSDILCFHSLPPTAAVLTAVAPWHGWIVYHNSMQLQQDYLTSLCSGPHTAMSSTVSKSCGSQASKEKIKSMSHIFEFAPN